MMLKIELNSHFYKIYNRYMVFKQKKLIKDILDNGDFRWKNNTYVLDLDSKKFLRKLLSPNSHFYINQIISSDIDSLKKINKYFLHFIEYYSYRTFKRTNFHSSFKRDIRNWRDGTIRSKDILLNSMPVVDEINIKFKAYVKTKTPKSDLIEILLESNGKSFFETFQLKIFPKTTLYSVLYYIFVVNGYEKSFYNIAYKFINKMNFKTCPYCNRNYISIIEKIDNEGNQTRPQVDHFFPKSIYPLLAVSYYNLIPSCAACNLMKSDKDTYRNGLKSPYQTNMIDFKLSWEPRPGFVSLYSQLYLKRIKFNDEKKIDVLFEDTDNMHNNYFEIEKLYKEHKDIVLELLLIKMHYPKSYIEELKRFRFSDDEIYRIILRNYIDLNDLHKRPLSKLTRDIATDLKLLVT